MAFLKDDAAEFHDFSVRRMGEASAKLAAGGDGRSEVCCRGRRGRFVFCVDDEAVGCASKGCGEAGRSGEPEDVVCAEDVGRGRVLCRYFCGDDELRASEVGSDSALQTRMKNELKRRTTPCPSSPGLQPQCWP